MQSDSADQCSWCRHDLKSLPPSGGKPLHVVSTHHNARGRGHGETAATPEPPGPRAAAKGSHGVSGGAVLGHPIRTEVKPASGSLPLPVTEPPSGNGSGKPILGSFQAGKSKYYPDKIFDPVSQSHYDADSGTAEAELPAGKIVTEETNDLRQLSIFAVFYAVLLSAGGLVAHALPQTYLVILGTATFLAGLLLPVLRVAPFMSDDSNDLPIALALTLICGPFVGAMFYGVLWIIRGDANPAVVGIFLANLLARMTLDLSTGRSVIDLFSRMLPQMDPASFASSWMPLAGLFGWMCADPFKRADE
jgi:hypothetical protein